MRKKILDDTRHFFIQWLILGLILLTIGCAMSYYLFRQHSLIDTQEQVRLANLAKVLDANLGHQLDATNQALVGIRDEIPYLKTKEDGKSKTNRLLRAMSDAMPGVLTINVINAAGIAVASSRNELIGRNFSDRDYFKIASQHPDQAMLYVTPPFKTVLDVFGINLVRVVTGPKGKFAGIVAATLNPAYFNILLESVLYAPDMRASVNHSDGKVFLMVPNRKDVEGMDLAKAGSFYTRHVESRQIASLFTGTVYATGDERMIAMRTVKSDRFIADKHLMVAVSRDLPAIFAAWRNEVFTQGVLFGLLAFVAVFGLYIYQRREQKFRFIETGHVEQILESEERYRLLADHMRDVVWLMDMNLQTIYNSPSGQKMRGYTWAEMQEMPLDQHLTPVSLELAMEVLAEEMPKVQADPTYALTRTLELEFYRKDGTTVWTENTLSLIRNESGNPLYIMGEGRDITDRKRVDEALQQEQLLLKSIIDSLPNIFFLYSYPECKLISWNKRHETDLGYTADELKGRYVLDFHDQEYKELIMAAIKTVMEVGYGSAYDILVTKDGRKIPYFSTAVRFESKGELYFMGICEDITERKKAEEEKAKLEAQLFQSQKMEAIGTLAGGIAHDFNNILGAIIGYTELAAEEDQNEIQKQYLQDALNGAERARNLVKQILTFSRQDDHEKKTLDIKVLLKEAVKFLRSSIPTTVEIDQNLTEESCNIIADPTQMHQVIMNLCTNASHAMKETGGTLKIELANVELAKDEIPSHPDLQTGHYVKLTISDTGHGIDPALIQRIFDPFFTTKSVDEGTGLGLSVVYGIVKSHGGIINVYSEPDKGAAFHVYLPRITYGEDMKVDRRKPVTGGTERILFVDDEPALVDLGRRMLSSLGYYVTSVLSSVEALDLFHAKPDSFDLVITDMTLPKMTGIDLSRELLKIRPNIPIILCSGIKDPDTEAQVNAMGIKAYIMKPLTKRELSLVIREVLDGKEKKEKG